MFLSTLFFICQSFLCGDNEVGSNEMALNIAYQEDNVIGRTLLQKPNAIEIDGCRYASADQECKDDYVEQKIIHGKEINVRKYPFMVSLRKQRNDLNNSVSQYGKCYQHFCGGSLILDDVVITAAHCIEDFVVTGKTGLQKLTTELLATRESKCRHQDGFEDLLVNYIYIHPNYSSIEDSYNNDIALLFLKGLIKQSNAIINFSNAAKYENEAKSVVMIGFGITEVEYELESLYYSSRLREAQTKIREQSACLSLLGDYTPKNFEWDKLLDTKTMICTYSSRTDTCKGDSGGPLFIETDSGEFVLLGITSWGPSGSCLSSGEGQAPGIFTRISYFKDWITSAIIENSDANVEKIQDYGISQEALRNSQSTSVDPISPPEPTPAPIPEPKPTPLPSPSPQTGTSPASVTVQEQEANALLSINVQHESWTGLDACNNWYGINCTSNRVTKITFTTGTLAPELSILSKLQRFEVGSKRLEGTLPVQYSALSSLQFFDISGSNITGPLPVQYSALVSLKSFLAMQSSLTGTLPVQYSQLSSLNSFALNDNFLTGTLPQEYSQLFSSGTIVLKNNFFTGEVPAQYSSTSGLDVGPRMDLFPQNGGSLCLDRKYESVFYELNNDATFC